MAAVIGFGETGKTFSPIKAFAKDDFPALKAPNKATVNPLLSKLFAFSSNSCETFLNPGKTSINAAAFFNLIAVSLRSQALTLQSVKLIVSGSNLFSVIIFSETIVLSLAITSNSISGSINNSLSSIPVLLLSLTTVCNCSCAKTLAFSACSNFFQALIYLLLLS